MRQHGSQPDIKDYNNVKQMKIESHEQRDRQTRSLMQQLDNQMTLTQKQTSKIHSPRVLASGLMSPSKSLVANVMHEADPTSRGQSLGRKGGLR